MTTVGEARAELIAAIRTAGAKASDTPNGDPPYCYVAGNGVSEQRRVVTGQMEASFRITMIGGAVDESKAAASLDTLKQTVLTALRGLTAWRFAGEVGPDGSRSDLTGAIQLQADAFASRLVDI